jgi:hypothetical protein
MRSLFEAELRLLEAAGDALDADEDGQASEQAPFPFAQLVVAPVQRGPQGPVALRGRAAAAGQQPEAVLQPGQELPGGQHARAGGRQLEGQGEAVQPLAHTILTGIT